jgi:hypothetical protein
MTGLSLLVPIVLSVSIFYAVLFGHYVMQLSYSPRQLKNILGGKKLKVWLILLSLFSLAQFTKFMPMEIFFGIHFLFSEIYSSQFRGMSFQTTSLRTVANICTYSLLMRSAPSFSWIPSSILIAALVASCGWLVVNALRAEKRREIGWLALYECVGALFAIFLPVGRQQLIDIIFYHLIWWFIFPLKAMPKKNIARYALETSLITAAFLLLTPASFFGPNDFRAWTFYGTMSGNLHITLSFAISLANPFWINAIFNPKFTQSSTELVSAEPPKFAKAN